MAERRPLTWEQRQARSKAATAQRNRRKALGTPDFCAAAIVSANVMKNRRKVVRVGKS